MVRKKSYKEIKTVPYVQILCFLLGAILRVLGGLSVLYLVFIIIATLSTGEYLWGFGRIFLCLIFMGLMLRIAGVVETMSFSKLLSLEWWKAKDLDA